MNLHPLTLDVKTAMNATGGSMKVRDAQKSRLLTVEQAAERLNLKTVTVRAWIWRRRLEHVKLGRAVRIPEHALEQLLERGTVPAVLAGSRVR
jgi:excisionase family DNA binding protein